MMFLRNSQPIRTIVLVPPTNSSQENLDQQCPPSLPRDQTPPINDFFREINSQNKAKPTFSPSGIHKKYLKNDYQKNITINVVKCCIREILSCRYRGVIGRMCKKVGTCQKTLNQLVSPLLKQVVISLGDLKKMLTGLGQQIDPKLKVVFSWFLEWYLRKRYMHYLLLQGKMEHKERYVEYKNKFMLYLLEIRDIQNIKSAIHNKS